ncbi:uncharacterized protein LOC129792077 [Lutzomyia longipalpis]|uniref:uncharacterized protein LOC129792077 n=1 Tax=Lutzomyia longipalpis TaxID=7200 RepID=UPI0024845BBB|nr:uncharacterized protein LOC129792077 [Lutzomyia longipalpis]
MANQEASTSKRLEQSLSKLHRERGRVKGRLTRVETYLNSTESFTVELLAVHEENLPEIKADFKKVQALIYDLVTDTQMQDEENEEQQFNERWLCVAASIKQCYNSILQSSAGDSDNTLNSNNVMEKLATALERLSLNRESAIQPRIKLPDLPMAKFTGKYSEWESFRDVFLCNIHNNPALTAVQKFQYLKGLLIEKAESIIKHLRVTEENYTKAWEILEERFSKKHNAAEELVQLFMNQPTLTKQDSTALRKMYDIAREVTNGLNSLDCDERDVWLIHIYINKMDHETKTLWARENNGSEIPTFSKFLEFLDERCNSLESIQLKSTVSNNQGQSKAADSSSKGAKPKILNKDSHNPTQNQKSYTIHEQHACKICAQTGHAVFHCPTLTAANAQKRLQLVQEAHLCTNCLKATHTVESCKGSNCKQCQLRHNTLLHDAFSKPAETSSTKAKPQDTKPINKPEPQPSTSTTNMVVASTLHTQDDSTQNKRYEILLPTISLFVTGADGRYYRCRAFYDSCSQPNLITRRFAEKAFLQLQPTTLRPLKGITQQTMNLQYTVTATITSRDKKFSQTVNFVVVDEIADRQPNFDMDISMVFPSDITLADPEFNKPGRVDMLIGAQLFGKTRRMGAFGESPEFTETAFGYIASGSISMDANTDNNTCFLTMEADSLHQMIEKFWKIEEAENNSSKLTPNEQYCEQHFVENTTRDESGRFIVRLPTKENLHSIGDTKSAALKRFLYMEKKLQRDPKLKEQYVSFMREYERLGHMRPEPESYQSDLPEIYLPHHAVIKTSSKSTPVRVVFDGSAKSSTGISFNDVLLVGPKVQDDLLPILLRFRQYLIAIKADIRKMFRQIGVHEKDQVMIKIFWRESPDQPLITYLLTTVTYGTACASYLSTRCMQQLVQEEGDNYPLAKQPATSDFYVDDFMSGQDSVADATELCAQIHSLMKQGGFELTKWVSNNPEVIQQFPPEEHELEPCLGLSPDDTVKALGLKWNTKLDTFAFDAIPYTDKLTKRTMLSEISKIYDPLGLLTPITITAKIMMQALWLNKVDWDTDIEDSEILKQWAELQQSYKDMHMISIPRRITSHAPPYTAELIAFSDASTKAYAACIYVRTVSTDGEVCCRLLCAKSRVAPIKPLSIPRLELCGALMATQLIRLATSSLTIRIDSIKAFTDSTVVLHWLAAEDPRKWKTFVANRVADIQSTLPREHWDYVPSEHNPADVASRGTTARELSNDSLWWHGPNLEVCGLPEQQLQITEDETILEQRVLSVHHTNPFWEIIKHYSQFSRLVRVIAYCNRFIHNKLLCKRENTARRTGPLQVSELDRARLQIVKAAQQESFAEDIHNLQRNKEVSRKSSIRNLNPFLDDEGILRVGGRIEKSNLKYNQKHQILLHSNHHLTELIVRKCHADTLHGGHQLVLSFVRQQYWPIRGINIVKKIARNCIQCFKTNPKLSEQMMGNLPASRVDTEFTKPFKRIGIDFCGPFMVKPPLRRSAVVKVYVAVYICMVTRAIHLELVHDLTSEAFIASLRRFCGRRGRPTDIYCDNGKNFVGAANQLTELHKFLRANDPQDAIITYSSEQGINFHFIPPYSPHFGGSWEAGVKSFKTQLKRVAGNTVFTTESLETIMVEIEAILNSRPLCSLSNDPNDYTALTPGHFLGTIPDIIPNQDLTHIQQNRLSKWRLNEQILQHFWKRWHKEILTSMQQRKKWQKDHSNIRINDLVYIQEDNVPPLKWPLGRVISVSYGDDGRVRCAKVKTQHGTCERAITRLAVLPNGDDEDAVLNRVQRGQDVTARSHCDDH